MLPIPGAVLLNHEIEAMLGMPDLPDEWGGVSVAGFRDLQRSLTQHIKRAGEMHITLNRNEAVLLGWAANNMNTELFLNPPTPSPTTPYLNGMVQLTFTLICTALELGLGFSIRDAILAQGGRANPPEIVGSPVEVQA